MNKTERKNAVKRLWQGFWLVAHPQIWICSTIPMLVGTALAYGTTGRFDLYWFIVGLIGLYFIEIGKNAANDLMDYATGVDLVVAPRNRTPFSGGRNRALVNGNVSVFQVTMIAVIMLGFGGVFGIYIALLREPLIFWIGLGGLFLAAAYSLPPFMLSYRGLGELSVGLAFGPLIVSGAFAIQANFITVEALLVSLPIGFLVTNILFINQFPDYEADKLCNKRNWVVRLGKTRGLKVYSGLFLLSYGSIILLLIWTRNPFWLLSFISLPFVLKAVKVAKQCYNDIPNLIGANIGTINVYQLTGFTMMVSAILQRR
ncbi:prenyltransferase [Dethiobacter alkaliphilus]|uniref:prenyltransferase n=1 Tax=Dethiobacter alkaliphilus TaxID=427926 RepID=UPI00222756E0|nr:prenyltransferase [Dethiobacter alkaliphilus]MCW3491589.1 prenyltransferase [Dethiobacter alkaliphilus]